MPGFWDTKALILWIGDLDADAKPDFVFDVSDDYESKCCSLVLIVESRRISNRKMRRPVILCIRLLIPGLTTR